MLEDVLLFAIPLLLLVGSTAFLVRDFRGRRRRSASVEIRAVRRDGPGAADPSPGLPRTGRQSLPDLLLDTEGLSGPAEPTPSAAVTLYEQDAEEDEATASRKRILVCAAGITDRGRARAQNEDAILLLPEEQVFVIADGMGGHAAGDVASKLAVETIESAFRERRFEAAADDAQRPKRAAELVSALTEANRRIRDAARASRRYGGMGATVVGARFSERKQRVFIGHVGDSRCYRMRDGQLRLLTQDHTLARYGATGTIGSRVRRALGLAEHLTVDVLVDRPRAGDVYVLCSDGLNKMLDEDAIARIVGSSPSDPQQAARELVDAANQAGGKDNVSVIVVGVRPPHPSPSGSYGWTAS